MSILSVTQSFFISGCQVQTTNPASCQPDVEAHFQDVSPALTNITDTVPESSILAFGYTHREVPSDRSAVKIFANNILPQLAGEGYHDLVLEVFPHGKPTDLIEKEIAEFNRSGTIGTEMKRFLNVTDRTNFEVLLQQVRNYGIEIHSGGVDYDNIYQTIWYPDFKSYPQRVQMAREEIAKNSGGVIKALADQGKKVFSLNGTRHNDLYPTPLNASSSFGKSLNAAFPGKFVEIDLVIPELSARKDYYKDLPLSSKCVWKHFIPSSGINLVSELGANSYLLFWPWLNF